MFDIAEEIDDIVCFYPFGLDRMNLLKAKQNKTPQEKKELKDLERFYQGANQ